MAYALDPREGEPQDWTEPKTKAPDATLAALEAAAQDPVRLTPDQRALVGATTGVTPVPFARPFEASQWVWQQSYDGVYLNLAHAFGAELLRCVAAYGLAELRQRIPVSERMSIRYVSSDLNDVRRLIELISRHRLLPGPLPELPPDLPDPIGSRETEIPWRKLLGPGEPLSFGQVLTEWPPKSPRRWAKRSVPILQATAPEGWARRARRLQLILKSRFAW